MENKNKKGLAILVVGQMGSGKSPITKELSENFSKDKLVYDVRLEYPEDWTKRFDIDDFLDEVDEATNTFIVVEEASTVMDGYNKRDYLNMITNVEHANNVIVYLFHGWKLVPSYLLPLCSYIVMLPTGEEEKTVKDVDKRLLKFYKKMPKKKNKKGRYYPMYIDTRDPDKWTEF